MKAKQAQTKASPSSSSRESTSIWFSAPKTIELRPSIAAPPASTEVSIDALFSAISHGTEMLVYRGEVQSDLPLDISIPTCRGGFGFPVKYGYASVGRVAEVGSDVANLEPGDLVFAFNPHETRYTIPASCVVRLPDRMEPRSATLIANVETALNAILDAAPRVGETVLIIGQGVIGLLITWMARRAGAGLVVTADTLENRRRVSKAFGADLSIDPLQDEIGDRLAEITGGAGADVVIEASGQPAALDVAIKAASHEARVVVVSWYGLKRAALSLGTDFHRKRLTLKSSQVSSLDPALGPRWTVSRRRQLAVRYIREIPCDRLISHVFPFERAAEAYRLVDEHPERIVQVVLDYNG